MPEVRIVPPTEVHTISDTEQNRLAINELKLLVKRADGINKRGMLYIHHDYHGSGHREEVGEASDLDHAVFEVLEALEYRRKTLRK